MNEPYYAVQDMRRQGPARPQYNILQPQFIQPPRPVAPRERYRATQYDHPMYDEVEDDNYGRATQLDSSGTCPVVRIVPDRTNDVQTSVCFNNLTTTASIRLRKAEEGFRSLLPQADLMVAT